MHHILAEVIQVGLVLETNVDEISDAGVYIRQYLFLDPDALVIIIIAIFKNVALVAHTEGECFAFHACSLGKWGPHNLRISQVFLIVSHRSCNYHFYDQLRV